MGCRLSMLSAAEMHHCKRAAFSTNTKLSKSHCSIDSFAMLFKRHSRQYQFPPKSKIGLHTNGGHATTRFLEGFLGGSLKASASDRRRLEGAQKAETRPFAEYNPLCVRPKILINYG